jgi:hypothetical protein
MCKKATPRAVSSSVSVPDACDRSGRIGGAFRRPPIPPTVRAVGRDGPSWAQSCDAGRGSRLGEPSFGGVAGVGRGVLLLRLWRGSLEQARKAHEAGIRTATLPVDRQALWAPRGTVPAGGGLRLPAVRAHASLCVAQAHEGHPFRKSRNGVPLAVRPDVLEVPRGFARATPPVLSTLQLTRRHRGAASDARPFQITLHPCPRDPRFGECAFHSAILIRQKPSVAPPALKGTVPFGTLVYVARAARPGALRQ